MDQEIASTTQAGQLTDNAPYQAESNTRAELKQAIRDANEVLACATTVFPVALFPDTMTVDRTKITASRRTFFKVAEVMSIRIEDVLQVTANVGPFFGSIRITSRFFNDEQPFMIDKFKRDDALRLKRIIQGYVVALKNQIDCSQLSTQELATMLDQLGKDDHKI